MIITLVFFVLATIILGVTTYLGFEDATKWEAAAAEAKKEKDAAVAQAAEQTSRRNVLRIAVGTDTPQDREDLSGAAKSHGAAILDEHKLLTDKLGPAAFPTRNAWTWPLINDLQAGGTGGGDARPAPAPNMAIPALARQWARMYQDMKTRFDAEVAAKKKAEADTRAAQDAKDKAEETFNNSVAALTQQIKDKIAAMDKAFQGLKTTADAKAADFKTATDEYAEAKSKLEETLRLKEAELVSKNQRINQLLNPDPSDWEAKFRHWNVAKTAERMGKVTDRTETFVSLQFATKMALVPGQTFVVIAPTGSLVEVLEREKALEKRHHEFSSLGAREPFADNEMVKGTVEITDVTSNGYSAQARVTFEAAPIRNPISRGDQLFNVSLSTGAKEHVAFCGIIDLDGDGRPNNEEFVRILEKNNLVVDAYLDLKTGEIKKRGDGLGFRTKFLIVGSDAPLVGNVKAMVDDAKAKGVQLIDARMFLNLIGVKPPKGAAPPAYSQVELGGRGAKNPGDPEAPMPPAVPVPEEKKE
jgi:hypothetical protein